MTKRLAFALLVGLALLAAVLMRFDLAAVGAAFSRAGIGGFALIIVSGLAAEIVLALGLYPLLNRAPSPLAIFAARQLRDSMSDVLPITQLGGLVFAARALALAGVSATEAAAAVIADLTTEAFAQGLYVLAGVILSLPLLRANAALSPYVDAMLAGAVLLSIASMIFALVQSGAGKWAHTMGERLFSAKLGAAQAFHDAINAIYRRRDRLAMSIALQFLGWIASGLWLWVVLKAMGLSPSLGAAIAWQALVEGLKSATVFIPASIGVQEAAYAALAAVFGLAPEIGLAVSLLRRARDVVVAVPVLLTWQAVEARRAKLG